MNKVVILEGPDGSGKTTLAAHMVEKLGFEYRHEGPPPPDCDRLHYYGKLLLDASHSEKPVVFDRFHLGELIYGPIKRHEDKLGYDGLFLMQRLIQATGAKLIICLPPFEVTSKSWYDKFAAGQDYLQSAALFRDSYYRFKALTGYFGHYDWTKKADERSMKSLLKDFVDNGEAALPAGSVGSTRAQFLIVGEQANHDTMDIPFFSMTNSSGFLNRALWDAGYQEQELAFTNAFDIKHHERDIRQVRFALPGLAKVIALGGIAGKALEKAKVEFIQIPHPSYFKRFRNGQREEYVKTLRSIREGVVTI